MSCILIEEEDTTRFLIRSSGFQYDLNSPDDVHILPGRLREISGLSYWKDNVLLCVEDERGYVYCYDHEKEEIIREVKFGKKGDYEGITLSNEVVYVIRSDGRLYYFKLEDEPDVTKVKLPFSAANNLEGISVGHKEDELYIACKGSPEISDRKVEGRAVYTYNIKRDKLKSKPYIHLTAESFAEEIKKAELKPSKHLPFMSSGIAIHPITEDVFLLSSVGKLLVVFNKSGKLLSMAPLKRSIFLQPEGICFDHTGNLFIASEGRGKKGYILKFKYQEAN